MKENKMKRPPDSSLKRDGEIWWEIKDGKWLKCIPYNIKEEEIKKPQPEGESMNNMQFEIINSRFEQFDKRFEQIDKRFEQIDKRFEQINMRFEQIDKKFEQIDKKFEQIDKRFEQIDKRFEQIDKRFEQIDRKFDLVLEAIKANQVAITNLTRIVKKNHPDDFK